MEVCQVDPVMVVMYLKAQMAYAKVLERLVCWLLSVCNPSLWDVKFKVTLNNTWSLRLAWTK